MSCVEVLATGIKIESKQSKAFGGSRIAKNQSIKNTQLQFDLILDPLKIKRSRASVGNDQAIFTDQKPKA